jgi:diguanylate cyclase (GGDEF)-like protein
MDKNQEGFSQVAITLIEHYDCVFYVDIETGSYTNLMPMKFFKTLGVPFNGEDFFSDLRKFTLPCIHPNDLDIIKQILDKNLMLERLAETGKHSVSFRVIKNGKILHIRHSEFMCPDKGHVICCLENIEDEFQRKEVQKKQFESVERLARFDELTGVRNKNAFKEFSNSIEEKLKKDKHYKFGIVLCDMNDLKLVNDTRGHSFGDERIQRTSRMICSVFTHSPVFRIGGDEFVVILIGQDYERREELLNVLKDESYDNKITRSGPVVACGLAVYDSEKDGGFSDVFERADKEMYKNKKEVKSMNLKQNFRDMEKIDKPITAERKRLLDALFGALCTVSGGGYVYLNDMRFDYSRWALSLVDDFGMQSEYMYHADKLWLEKVHPDDIEAYKKAVEATFSEGADIINPLTYRARKADGTYALLTTRGFILSDGNGKSDYFGGIIVPL